MRDDDVILGWSFVSCWWWRLTDARIPAAARFGAGNTTEEHLKLRIQ